MALQNPLPEPEFDLEAALWDFDGTLVDSRGADELTVRQIVERFPAAAAGVDLFWQLEGETIVRRIERAWPEWRDAAIELFDHQTPPTVFPGVVDALKYLSELVPQGVVSSRRSWQLVELLDAVSLSNYFEVVVGAEDVTEHKPHPEGLKLAMERLGARPSCTVYFGDTLVDMETAHRAGTQRVHALWRYPYAERHAAVEDRFIKTVSNPRDIIRLFSLEQLGL